MTAFARRRRARFEARWASAREDDPDNAARKKDAERQMGAFDLIPEAARERLRGHVDDVDLIETVRLIERRGPSDAVRAICRERGILPCDLQRDEWLSLELERGRL